jgi:hypothetical protein
MMSSRFEDGENMQPQTKTIASLFETLSNVRRLWEVLAVGAPPEDRQLATWMSQFTEEELLYAFTRVGKKFNVNVVPDDAHRYATSVLVAERRKAQPAQERSGE